MNRILSACLAGCTLLAMPFASAQAQTQPAHALFAQNVQVGPNGVRIEGDRNRPQSQRSEGRRSDDRRGDDRGMSRQRNRFGDDRMQRRGFGRMEHCRTFVVRHRTPFGVRTERVRRCR